MPDYKRYTFVFVGLILVTLCTSANATVWPKPARTWGGAGTEAASAVARDSSGNLYVVGSTTSVGAGASDVLIVKYSSNGTLLWSKTWGGGAADYATAIALGPDNYLYVTGATSSFGAGWYDIFLLKISLNGNLVWGTTWGGSSYETGQDIGFDASGNIYVVGQTYSYGPCCASSVLIKFSPSGSVLRTNSYKGPATYDTGLSLTVDSNQNVIVAGISWDYSVSPNHNSILLLKYDPAGNLVWSENWSSPIPGEDESWAFRGITTDSSGNIYVAGRHSDQCNNPDFSQCDFRVLVLKVDSNGGVKWANTWGIAGAFSTAGSVALDSRGHLLVSAVENVFGASGSPPMIDVLSYDTSGNLLSQTAWSSQGTASQGSATIGMLLDGSDSAYVVAAASNNSGVWAATTGTQGTPSDLLVSNSYSVGAPTGSTFPLTNPTVVQTKNGTADSGGGGSDLFIAQYLPYMSGGPFLTYFPLPGVDAYSAQINSVFDHSMYVGPNDTRQQQYCADSKVVAYTGEEGDLQYGAQVVTAGHRCGLTGAIQDLAGYKQQSGNAFIVNGQYVGGPDPADQLYLFYDGHPGYDYRASCGTPVYAAASGTVKYPASIPGANGAKFHILEVDPDFTATYKIYYLHLSNYPTNNCTKKTCGCPYNSDVAADGQHVNAGDLIGYSGDAGLPGQPHLHFEVQVLGLRGQPSGIPVDPYGWSPFSSATNDPYTRAVNLNLWKIVGGN